MLVPDDNCWSGLAGWKCAHGSREGFGAVAVVAELAEAGGGRREQDDTAGAGPGEGRAYRCVQVRTRAGRVAGRGQGGMDAVAAAGQGEDEGRCRTGRDGVGEFGVVDTAIMAPRDQGDPAAGERGYRREGGQDVCSQAVINERDA